MSKNTDLQERVLAELSREPSVTASQIGVGVKDGVIILTGHVSTLAEKFAAENAAWRVKGVRAVAEEIEVRLPLDTKRSDEDIANAVLERLRWNASIPNDAIKVTVENGWVTLEGEVPWQFQRANAAEEVHCLLGVRGVSNRLSVRPTVDTAELTDDITHALHRSWFFDPATVIVSAKSGKVRLSGTVKTPHERQLAAATAWAASGVTDVENDLQIA